MLEEYVNEVPTRLSDGNNSIVLYNHNSKNDLSTMTKSLQISTNSKCPIQLKKNLFFVVVKPSFSSSNVIVGFARMSTKDPYLMWHLLKLLYMITITFVI